MRTTNPLHLLLAALTCVLLTAGSTPGAQPFVEKLELFTVGDRGYKIFHTPGIVVTAKGTVLAWCEARKKGGDWDDIHILLRRSTDDGKTWSEPRSIGYWWTDTPRWDLDIAQRLFGTNWASTLRALPDDAPGRRRYAEFLRAPGPHDDRAFLRLIARELYSVTAGLRPFGSARSPMQSRSRTNRCLP